MFENTTEKPIGIVTSKYPLKTVKHLMMENGTIPVCYIDRKQIEKDPFWASLLIHEPDVQMLVIGITYLRCYI